MADLEARIAVVEWALRAGRGELPGLDWVDATLRPEGEPFAIVRDDEGVRFRHLPIGDDLPGPLVEAAEEADADGQPTALDAVQRIVARAQWLTSSRALTFTPWSPVPGLLAALVETYGVDAELHDRDLDALAKLLVHLPRWHARRGDAAAGIELLRAALGSEVPVQLGAAGPRAFTCQSSSWWADRPAPEGPLRIDGGVVCTEHPVRDVVLGWIPADRFPHELLRLLPSWASPRLVLETDGNA
ncbi:MAG: hypothetical protein KC656_10595 [Myxococcales bacterium]|nr:hypothetical protein [Myxococcales bacterium]MCB9670651.1 hypothetical protein [Alphaproteobacteria bacterium]MCB9693787.1 hypothetical protein [Alphaproteobacteria bacterium]